LRVLFFIVAIALLMLSATCSAASLEVNVSGLKNDSGHVHVALFNKSEGFPYHEAIFMEDKTRISDGAAKIKFDDLLAGAYGIAVYHDENENDEFDQGLFGIPLEDYGFSNNAPVFFGPPSFDEAKFEVKEPSASISIDISK